MLEKSVIQKLRKQAHALSPIVMIGQNGLTESVIKEIDNSLVAHELLKIKIHGYEKADQVEMVESACSQLNAELIQKIGNIAVLYRDKNTPSPLAKEDS